MSEEILNPKEAEEKLLEEQAKSLENQSQEDPAAIAAGMFGIYLPRFLAHVWNLSSKDRARVLCALVESPLNTKPYTFASKEAKEAFDLGEALLQAKFMVLQASFMDHSQELAEATDPSVLVPEETVLEAPEEIKGE